MQQAHCSDIGIILSQALKLGVEVVSGVSKGDVLYRRRHRSLHAQYGIRVEVTAPATPSSTDATESHIVSAPNSPMRRNVRSRVKEQLEISASMSELDISLISSLVSLYTTESLVSAPRSPFPPVQRVHPAAVRDRSPVELSVRAWTKVVRIKEPGILQCSIKRIKKGNLSTQLSTESGYPWIEYLQFPSDNV